MNKDLSIPLANKRINRVAVASFFFLAGLVFSSWASRIPNIQTKLQLNDAGLGGVLLALPVGLLLSLPLAGWLVARFGSRIIVAAAALLYCLTLPLLARSEFVWQLVACLFLFGLAGNLLNISINTQAVGVEALYGRTIMASFHGIWSLAGFTGAAVGSLMIAGGIIPGRHFYIIATAGLLILTSMFAFTLKKDVNQQEQKAIFGMPDRSLINLGLIAFCSMICEGAMFDWSGVYFQKVVQVDKKWIAAGYTAFMSTMATGRFIGDWLATRWGIKKILQGSGIVVALGLFISVLLPYTITAIIGFLFVGAGVSSVIPLVYSAAGRSKVLSAGVAIAAVSTIGYLGFLIGPPLIGFIAQAINMRVSFVLIALLGLTISIIATRIKF